MAEIQKRFSVFLFSGNSDSVIVLKRERGGERMKKRKRKSYSTEEGMGKRNIRMVVSRTAIKKQTQKE